MESPTYNVTEAVSISPFFFFYFHHLNLSKLLSPFVSEALVKSFRLTPPKFWLQMQLSLLVSSTVKSTVQWMYWSLCKFKTSLQHFPLILADWQSMTGIHSIWPQWYIPLIPNCCLQNVHKAESTTTLNILNKNWTLNPPRRQGSIAVLL